MKKIITIFLSCLFIVACKKTTTTPNTPPQTQAIAPPSLTAQEQSLIGYWIMDSSAFYSNNVKISTSIYTNSVTCIMNFKNTIFATGSEYYNGDSGYNQCISTATFWKAPNAGSFMLGSQTFPITLLTSTNLIFIQGSNISEWRYYFHK